MVTPRNPRGIELASRVKWVLGNGGSDNPGKVISMKTTRLRAFLAVVVFAAAGAMGLAGEPQSDEKLKDTALKLNELADEKERLKKVAELAKDKATAKKLVKLASEVHKAGKDKDSPYKFHGALALA